MQYGELARLFHVWLRVYAGTVTPDERAEATPNPMRDSDTRRYEEVVAECLTESRRTLAPNGRLVLTFHNKKLAAWEALGNALMRAGFVVAALAVVRAENAADHSKRGKRTFLCDLVIECVPRTDEVSVTSLPEISGRILNNERKNLLAVGLAVSEVCNLRSGESIRALYLENLDRLGGGPVLIR